MRTYFRMSVPMLVLALAACGRPGDPASGEPSVQASTDVAPATAGGGDPCALVADTDAMFGEAVTANVSTMRNGTRACEWKRGDGMICGSVSVFGPGWNEVPDVPANYSAMVTSLGAFGEVHDVAGVGEEAKAVDGGIVGAQLAFRTSKVAALVAAGCPGPIPKTELAEKLAREVARQL